MIIKVVIVVLLIIVAHCFLKNWPISADHNPVLYNQYKKTLLFKITNILSSVAIILGSIFVALYITNEYNVPPGYVILAWEGLVGAAFYTFGSMANVIVYEKFFNKD